MTAMLANPYADGMLRTVWTLELAGERVENVEGLCRGVLNRVAAGISPPLERCDYDEWLGWLLGQVVVLTHPDSPNPYDATKGGPLRAWLYTELVRDLIDELRRRWGRQGQKRVVDGRLAEQAFRDAGGDDRAARVDLSRGVAAEGADDAGRDRTFPREWTDLPGDRGAVGADPVGGLGGVAGGGGPGRADRAGAGEVGGAVGEAARAGVGAPAWVDCGGCGWRHYPFAPNGVEWWHFPDRCVSCGAELDG